MSRGPGRIMQAILAEIQAGETTLTMDDAARRIYGTDRPSRAQLVGVRRATHRLAEQGLISVGGLTASFASRPQWIYAAPPTTDEQKRKDAELDQRLAASAAAISNGYRKSHRFTCKQCGDGLKVDCLSVSHGKTYCSSACRQAAYRARLR